MYKHHWKFLIGSEQKEIENIPKVYQKSLKKKIINCLVTIL